MVILEGQHAELQSRGVPSVDYPEALRFLGRSTYTLFRTPQHDTLHADVENMSREMPQALNPPIAEVARDVRGVLHARKPNVLIGRYVLSAPELIMTAGLLVQFTDHTQDVIPAALSARPDNSRILKQAFVARSQEQSSPLTFGQQLETAIDVCEADMIGALWSLFFASRHYARWLDSPIVPANGQNKDGKRQEMIEWRRTIAACKGQQDSVQDPAGDAYYAWTHAMSQVVYRVLPEQFSALAYGTSKLFRVGTVVMHSIVHSINEQAVPNDHTIAAKYGNAIGDEIVEYARSASGL